MRLGKAVCWWAVMGLWWLAACVQAAPLEVQGSAPIVAGDRAMAHQLAYQQALERAMGQAGGARLASAQVVNETELEGVLQLTVAATLSDSGADEGACLGGYLRKVVVAAFALEHPEQLLPDEFSAYSSNIALALRAQLDRAGMVLAEHAEGVFPYRQPDHAPVMAVAAGGGFRVVELARRLRAQYVLAGVVRDFGIETGGWAGKRRNVVIQAYLHDGFSGHIVATQTFSASVSGDVALPPGTVFGSAAFVRHPLGAVLDQLLGEMAQWAGLRTRCLPFAARVLRVEKDRVYLDVGAEAHVNAGDTLVVFRPLALDGRANVVGRSGELLGGERRPLRSLVLREVYPMFSIAHVDPKDGRSVAVGDEVWGF